MTAPTPGRALHESLCETGAVAFGKQIGDFPTWDGLTHESRRRMETAAGAAIARRLDGLMPMGLRFADADPVSVCLVGECKWHGHGDSMNDAVRAWTAHLAADHRLDWPED